MTDYSGRALYRRAKVFCQVVFQCRSSSHVIDADERCWSVTWVLNPVEDLRHAVDLIIVSSVWELLHLGLKIAQPFCALWQEKLSGFDLGCLSMEPGDLVLFRIDGNRAEAAFKSQVLNKTGAGALILDQDRGGAMKVRQFPHTLLGPPIPE